MFFQKLINKVKIIDLKKIRLYEVSSKVATLVKRTFYSKILKWQKVSHQEKKMKKVQICQNAPRPLRRQANFCKFHLKCSKKMALKSKNASLIFETGF